MQRDLYLFDDLARLREFLATESDETGALALGVGFFACMPHAEGAGVELTVAPPFLDSALRSRMVVGQAAPYSREVFLFGDEGMFEGAQRNVLSVISRPSQPVALIEVPRWLVVGSHPGVFSAGQNALPAEVWPGEVAAAETLSKAINVFLASIQSKVHGLRPLSVVFLLETGLLCRYFSALSTWKSAGVSDKSWGTFLSLDPAEQEEVIGKAVLTWLAEDGLHPRVAVVCRTSREYEALLLHSHWNLVNSPSCANVVFRL